MTSGRKSSILLRCPICASFLSPERVFTISMPEIDEVFRLNSKNPDKYND